MEVIILDWAPRSKWSRVEHRKKEAEGSLGIPGKLCD
jgi:hypothetical protein